MVITEDSVVVKEQFLKLFLDNFLAFSISIGEKLFILF